MRIAKGLVKCPLVTPKPTNFDAFAKAGIEIPYGQTDVAVRKISKT